MVDTARYEAALKARLEELDERLHDAEKLLDEPAPKDFEDQATEREGDEVLEELGHAGEREIAMIQAALKRIETGEFGACVRCGGEILPERLDALPHTPLCRTCAREVEAA